MSEVEHYFENLIHYGKDVSSNENKDFLSKEVQEAVEECALHIRSLLGLGIITYTDANSTWIPVSEGLPEIDMSHPHHENYLVQYDSGYMDVASWSNVNRFWTDHVTKPHWNCAQFAEVIAWMPLPEQYKAESEGEG